MPSNTTSNYNLSQWQPDDKVLRTDFNADNAKIDAALKAGADKATALEAQVDTKASQSALSSEVSTRTSQVNTINNTLAKKGNCTIYYASYTGDGSSSKTLYFPKQPRLVFVLGNGFLMRAAPDQPEVIASNGAGTGTLSTATWSGTSLSWTYKSGSYYSDECCNTTGQTYSVFAFIDAST